MSGYRLLKVQMRIAHLSKIVKRTGEFIAGEKLAETGGAVGDLVR